MSPKASNMTLDKNLSFLFKSPPGFAKTLAATSFALGGPVYLAYFDKSKPVELKKYYTDIVHRPDLLDYIEYDVYGSHNVNQFHNKMIDFTTNCPYFAIICDSLTSMTGAAVNWSLGFRANPKKDKQAKSSDVLQLIPDWDEYKVETSLIVQTIDIQQTLPCHIIWTAHPLSKINITGSGASQRITKGNSLVTYGNKVADLVPGRFTEIYHFGKSVDWNTSPATVKYNVYTEAVGDDFAKTALNLPKEFDITNKLFYEVWSSLVNKKEEVTNVVSETKSINPFEKKWKV